MLVKIPPLRIGTQFYAKGHKRATLQAVHANCVVASVQGKFGQEIKTWKTIADFETEIKVPIEDRLKQVAFEALGELETGSEFTYEGLFWKVKSISKTHLVAEQKAGSKVKRYRIEDFTADSGYQVKLPGQPARAAKTPATKKAKAAPAAAEPAEPATRPPPPNRRRPIRSRSQSRI